MAGGGIGRASALLASGTMVSRVLGFVKTFVLASTIGMVASPGADAFGLATQLPSNIYSLIAAGLLSSVVVPQVVRAARHSDGGQTFINRLVTLAIVALGVVALLSIVAVPVITRVYAPSLPPDKFALVVAFGYWCMPQIFFYGLYAVLGEVLNARGVFAPFAWAPVINNVVGIVGMVAFGFLFGKDPDGGWGVGEWTPTMVAVLGGSATLGVVIQALVLFAAWWRAGLRYRLDFHWRGTGLGQAGRLAGWTFGMLLITTVAGTVETTVLTLGFGTTASVATFSNAFLLFSLPHAIIAVSISTAYFTRMSAAAGEDRMDDYVGDFSSGARLIGLFVVFATVGLAVLSPAIAQIYGSSTVDGLVPVLLAFLIGLVPYCALFLVQRAFYALEDTRTQFWLFLGTFPVHIFGMAIMSTRPVAEIAAGLALMQTIMASVRFLILFTLLRRRVGGVDGARILRSYVLYAIAAIAAGGLGFLLMRLLGTYTPDGFARSGQLPALIACAVGGVAMLFVYIAALLLLRSPDLRDALQPILRRVRGGAPTEDEAEFEDDLATAVAREEIDWAAGPPTELLQVEDLPQRPERRPEPPTDPVGVPARPTPEELELAAARAARLRDREERVYAGAWSMGMGATGDLTTAGIILPMHATPTSGPRTRRERRELEAKAAAALQAKRVAAERAKAAAEPAPWPGTDAEGGAAPAAPQPKRGREDWRAVAEGRDGSAPATPAVPSAPTSAPPAAQPRRTAPPETTTAPPAPAPAPTQRPMPSPRPGASRAGADGQRQSPPPTAPNRDRPAPPPATDRPRRESADDDENGQDLLASWFGDDDDL